MTTSNARYARFCCLLVVVTAVTIAGFFLPRVLYADAKPAAVITMGDAPAAFIPNKVTIKVGETVQWKNTGKAIHAVATSAVPAGAQSFDSGLMIPGKEFSHTFTVAGTYNYLCLPHANSGMVGEVIVTK